MTKFSLSRRPGRSWSVAVLLAAAIAVLTACGTGSTDPGPTTTVTQDALPSTAAPATGTPTVSDPATTPKPTPTKPAGRPVHIKTQLGDGGQFGVGMPVIAYFSTKITDGRSLSAATTATADGTPLPGAWYFEYSSAYPDYPIEGHWRPEHYWPAHSKVHVAIAAKGRSAGKNLVYDDSLTLDFSIGAKHVSTVNNKTHTMTVVSDGKKWGTFPVSLGASSPSNMRTLNGTKVIMEKGRDISMQGPGYYDPHIKYTQRLTYGGEYLHAAPWNTYNIGHGINSSNGCTNLYDADAKKLYGFLEVGDVVKYPNANGPKMQLGQGYGDWNLSWTQWQTGGLVPTT